MAEKSEQKADRSETLNSEQTMDAPIPEALSGTPLEELKLIQLLAARKLGDSDLVDKLVMNYTKSSSLTGTYQKLMRFSGR